MRNILDLLAGASASEDRGVHLYDRRGRRAEERSWAEVMRRARATGARFLGEGLAPRGTVFLQLPNSYELIEGFFGAISVGLVPCCLAPPRALGGLEVFQERIGALKELFPNSIFVARADVGDAVGLPYVVPPDPGAEEGGVPSAPKIDPETLAFLQLTSGSTKRPKAVCISHGALVDNVTSIRACGDEQPNDLFVSWLPFYHDMGLVGSLFSSAALATDLHVMQPETFVARPALWLKAISAVSGTVVSTAPNFAYEACVQRIPDEVLSELDLSRWRIAGCGAERVRPETLAAFAERFASVGFRSDSFVPCYGMAEATLAVTFGGGGREPRIEDGNVACGFPMPGTEILIRAEDGTPVPDGEQGEITVKSGSLFSGYAGAEEPSPIKDGWLYTGDRGYLSDGELFVTGRYKDLIIIDGVNVDPDEVEVVGEATVACKGGRCGGFSIEVQGREKVVLICESESESEEVYVEWCATINDRVARLLGFPLYDLLFVCRGSMRKTSSGKVQRSLLREDYEADRLDVLWRQSPPRR